MTTRESIYSKRKNSIPRIALGKSDGSLLRRIEDVTLVSVVAWPLNKSEVGVDVVLIETSLLFLC